MQSYKINIGPGTEIDIADLLISRLLIQANSGGGKSVLSRVLAEETNNKVPFIVFDDAGEYYPLKEKFGDIVVIGGQHADVEISLQAAKMLPKFIISNQLSVIIDLSSYDSMRQRVQYVKVFVEALMGLPQQYWKSYLIFLEEAHKYCGQQDKQDSAETIKDLLSGGRKKGYCAVLITQRISKLHKDAAAECNNKFVGRTILDLDMDRAAKELGFSASSEFTRLSLRDLEPGQFYAYGTSIEPQHVHLVKIKLPETKLIKSGHIVEIKPKKPTAKLLEALGKMNELPQSAAKELTEIKDLQAEVRRLNTELNKANKPGKGKEGKADPKEVAVLTEQLTKTKQYVFELQTQLLEQENLSKEWAKLAVNRKLQLDKAHKVFGEAKNKIDGAMAWLLGEKEKYPDPEKQKLTKKGNSKIYLPVNPHHSKISTEKAKPITTSSHSNGSLPKGEERILNAIASYDNGLNRKALTVITGYTRRTRDSYIFSLRNKGLADLANDKVVSTEQGIAALGPDFTPLPKGTELQEHWLRTLPTGEKKILEILLQHYPQSVTRDQISQESGYTRRTRDSYIYNMISKEIVNVIGKGEVKASEYLFD